MFLKGKIALQANIGADPWDVLHIGLAHTFGVLYGTATISMSLIILGIDVFLKGPIGLISVGILALVTAAGYLLGGPVGIGTVICAFCIGPVMQFAFATVRFDPTGVRHQSMTESLRILTSPGFGGKQIS